MDRPRLLLTMGDVAGVGPEIIARAWPQLVADSRPVVVGDPGWLGRGLELAEIAARVEVVERVEQAEATTVCVPCLWATDQDLGGVQPGQVSAEAGRAAYDYLCAAIDLTMAGE